MLALGGGKDIESVCCVGYALGGSEDCGVSESGFCAFGWPSSRSMTSPEVSIKPAILSFRRGEFATDSVLAQRAYGEGDGVADGGVEFGGEAFEFVVGADCPKTRTRPAG